MRKLSIPLTLALALGVTAPAAHADLAAWLAAVASGTPAGYVNSNVAAPMNDNIGTYTLANGATYEFIVNADNTGASSALMGALNTGMGSAAALKFEQWPDTLSYGVTQFGVFDHILVPNVENTDVHLVFVSDTTNNVTDLYVDGVNVGGVPYAPVLSGMVGIGQAHNPTNVDIDQLTGTIHGVAVYDSMVPVSEILVHRDAYFGTLGSNYCGPAIPNSTNVPAVIGASGSSVAADNNLSLSASDMPQNQFGYFLNSMTQGFVLPVPNSQGALCLGGAIGRYNGQVQNTGATGSFSIQLDLANTPTPSGTTAILAGESWNFTAWYRDANPSPTSNFTDGLAITFL